jgi:hypothetical protein
MSKPESIYMRILIYVLLFGTIVQSYIDPTPDLTGEWRSPNTVLLIEQDRGEYFVEIDGQRYLGDYKDDRIRIESPFENSFVYCE